jgi:hypothetical protein
MSPDSVVATTRQADVRGVVIDVIHASLEQELEGKVDPEFRAVVSSGARKIITGAMTEEWFYDVFSVAHSGLVDMITGSQEGRVVDLRDRKAALNVALLELGVAALEECAAVAGSRCKREAKSIMRQYRSGVKAVIEAIPDRTNLGMLVAQTRAAGWLPPSLGEPEAARGAWDTVRQVRAGVVAAAIGAFVALFLLSLGSAPRVFLVCGTTLVIAAGVYLAAASLAGMFADDWVSREFAHQLGALGQSDEVVRVASAGAQRVVRQVLGGALSAKALPATLALLGGAAAIAAGVAIKRAPGHRAA